MDDIKMALTAPDLRRIADGHRDSPGRVTVTAHVLPLQLSESPEHRACRDSTYAEWMGVRRATERRLPEEELHRLCAHPDFEYATTQGQRKAWVDVDTPPGGDGWVRNVHTGRDGWERFDYTEESYWMRPKPGVDNPVDREMINP